MANFEEYKNQLNSSFWPCSAMLAAQGNAFKLRKTNPYLIEALKMTYGFVARFTKVLKTNSYEVFWMLTLK